MYFKDVQDFINNPDKEVVRSYGAALIEKNEKLNAQINRTSILIVLIIISFVLIDQSALGKVAFGPFEVDDPRALTIFYPPFFAYLLLHNSLLSLHRSRVYKTSKIIFHYLVYKKLVNPSRDDAGEFVRLLIPFSFYDELYFRVVRSIPPAMGAFFVGIPALMLLIVPVWFVYIILAPLIDSWSNGFQFPVVIISTLLMTALAIFTQIKILLFVSTESRFKFQPRAED